MEQARLAKDPRVAKVSAHQSAIGRGGQVVPGGAVIGGILKLVVVHVGHGAEDPVEISEDTVVAEEE